MKWEYQWPKVVIRALVLIISIVIIVLFVVNVITGPRVQVDKYQIFQDLLILLLAIATLIGFAVNHLVKESVTKEATLKVEEITKSLKSEISNVRCKNLVNYGMENWQMGNVVRAIKRTREALKEGGLEDWNVVKAKNNLAFFLASYYKADKVEQVISEALKLADEVHAKYDPTNDDYNEPEWVETWVFVQLCAARTLQEKQSLIAIIKEFIKRDDLKQVKSKLEEDLRQLKENTQNTLPG